MVNPYAGEVALVVDGERQVLKLTLGALAELEEALGAGSLVELVERFEGGRYSVRDVLALILAGLRGGGWRATPRRWPVRRSVAGRWRRRVLPRNCWHALLPCLSRSDGAARSSNRLAGPDAGRLARVGPASKGFLGAHAAGTDGDAGRGKASSRVSRAPRSRR
jgi:hypothetical protein